MQCSGTAVDRKACDYFARATALLRRHVPVPAMQRPVAVQRELDSLPLFVAVCPLPTAQRCASLAGGTGKSPRPTPPLRQSRGGESRRPAHPTPNPQLARALGAGC